MTQMSRQPEILQPLARLGGIQRLLGQSSFNLSRKLQETPHETLHQIFRRTSLGNTAQWIEGLRLWLSELEKAHRLSHRLNAALVGGALIGMFLEVNHHKQLLMSSKSFQGGN